MIIWHGSFITKRQVEYVCNAANQTRKINNETNPMQSVYDNKCIYILFFYALANSQPCQRAEKLYPYNANDIRPAVRPAAKWNTIFLYCCHQKSLSSCSHTFYHLCRDIKCACAVLSVCVACGLCRAKRKKSSYTRKEWKSSKLQTMHWDISYRT